MKEKHFNFLQSFNCFSYFIIFRAGVGVGIVFIGQCFFRVCHDVFSRYSENTYLRIISPKFKILV